MATVSKLVHVWGTVEGRVRIQKTVYFLSVLGMKELDEIVFRYEAYGPSSDAVQDALCRLVSERVIREEKSDSSEEWQRYRYISRGEKTALLGDVLSDASQQMIIDLVGILRPEHWRTCELAATIHFLKWAKVADPEKNALGQKPANRPFLTEANRLLQRIKAQENIRYRLISVGAMT